MENRKYRINGIVQGVGFRPFVHKVASEMKLLGWVLNDAEGVLTEVQGNPNELNIFEKRLLKEAPPLSKVESIVLISSFESSNKYSDFRILKSDSSKTVKTLISPDYSVCNDCLEELFDENDRRYKYPFINCTNCGPRYTIIEDLPYDRKNTTMDSFNMCSKCEYEYNDIKDRRYHAQPDACYICGPKVSMPNSDEKESIENIKNIANKIINGKIVAIKSVGGFHLVCDAYNKQAVKLMRKRKKRDFKALAIMVKDIETAEKLAYISIEDKKTLESKERPIVLLNKREIKELELISPNNSKIGIMLPSAPIHYVLLKETKLKTLVMTSGNSPGNPIIYKDDEALSSLSEIADDFLLNNRDIYTFVDDSIVKNVRIKNSDSNKLFMIRRSRGYVPLPFKNNIEMQKILALGAELKNTIAISKGQNLFVSQHLGDLKSELNINRQIDTINHITKILKANFNFIACDMHPLFNKGKYINNKGLPVIEIQHHHAHMATCMFENKINTEVIGVIFDGTGYGTDGSIWGGEFLVGDFNKVERIGHIKPFKLIGGDKAIKEPYRLGLSLLFETYKDNRIDAFKKMYSFLDDFQLNVFYKMSQNNINTYKTTSMGRLFDAVSSMLGICKSVEYEGQAAIEMESCLKNNLELTIAMPYNINFINNSYEIDYRPLVKYLLENNGLIDINEMSRRFHSTIVKFTVEMCNIIREERKINDVVLGGGVFQNEFLLVNTKYELEKNRFKVYINNEIPCNDGGISVGQIMIANSMLEKNKKTQKNSI